MSNMVKVNSDNLLRVMKAIMEGETVNKTVGDIVSTVLRKNNDYGNAWQRYGIFTPLIRINDKILRVETLSDGRLSLVPEEGIKDTLKDIVGYALLALLWLEENDGEIK